LENPPAGNVRPYDLMAQRINRTQLPMLETVCRKLFAARARRRRCPVCWGAMPRCNSPHWIREKRGELQAALPVPGCLAVVRLKPLPGLMFVSVDPGLCWCCWMASSAAPGRPTTTQAAIAPAALRFLSLMLRNFAPGMTAAWAPVTPVELELVKQETNPRLVQSGRSAGIDVGAALHVPNSARAAGASTGCMPEAMLEPIREALTGDGADAAAAKQATWGRCWVRLYRRRNSRPARCWRRPNQSARAGAPHAGRHHSHRAAAAGHLAGGRGSPVPRALRRLPGSQRHQNSNRSRS
jgi:flagellar motor switch protein FliM